jgi:hypothetical protein
MYAKAFLILCVVLVTRLDQLDLGARLSKSQRPERNNFECVATPSQTYPCALMTIEGVKISVGYEEKSLRIRYLTTQDKKFKTPDGLQVGMWMKISEGELLAVPGWKILGPKAKSGWRPIFGYLGKKVVFSDGMVIDLSQPRHDPPRTGELQVVELEKGGV